VLYTHQKMKKSKTWQDGILRIRPGGNKAVLFDDKGQCLESIFIKSQVNAGDNLESERYLITVEAVKVNEKSFDDQPRKAETPAVDTNGVKPGGLPPRHLSVGLKRKFTGFQGPRQVEKKISTVEDGEKPTILPLSKQCQSTFPSKFYITSPLFSTICKKDAETNLPADFHEDACTDNDRERASVSSLLSAPFLDRCEETEKQNSDQSIVKPESPLITGHAKSSSQTAGHGAVSHNIRSTAQIIALLKSKPTQGCTEQTTSEATECLSRFQASENADSLCNKKSTVLPAFSGSPAKTLIQNIQHLPFTKGTVNDKKEWNAEMLLNLAEQPCDKEVTGQRHGKKANNLSQDLQDPCNTNSCFLPESTISRKSDSQFVPSSGDVSCSASPITFEKNLSRYREHSVTNGLKENSSVKLQSELQPRQNSERVPSDLELSVDVTLTEIGIVKEELRDVAQNSALRLHSCCEVVTHSKNEEVKCSIFDGENDGNHCTEGISSQLCDNVRYTRTTAEDSANQTRIEVELLGDGRNVKEINESQLSIEATNNKKDLDGCAAHTINGMSWIKSKRSDLLPGDTNVNECHPKTSIFEKTGSLSRTSTSRIISAMDERTEGDVIQLGCMKSRGVDLERFRGTKSDDIKPGSPLLALAQKSDPSYGSFQYIAEDHQKVFGISHREDTVISRSSIYPLGKGPSSPEETAIGETEFENVESINAFHEACKGERIGMDCLKCTAMAENSSDLPDLVNSIALLRALTRHSTALESLQKMEENNSILDE
ncbi:ZGRF1 protein, partial [Thalassarche chlororhynchos]|nr:ZGRF1 protein [Thalassarche chlororhynchos]